MAKNQRRNGANRARSLRPKGNHVKECSWWFDPLSKAGVCALGYLLMWSCLPSAFTPRLLLSLAISNSLSNLSFLHGFIISWSNSSSFTVFWLKTPNNKEQVLDSNRKPTPGFFRLLFFSFVDLSSVHMSFTWRECHSEWRKSYKWKFLGNNFSFLGRFFQLIDFCYWVQKPLFLSHTLRFSIVRVGWLIGFDLVLLLEMYISTNF